MKQSKAERQFVKAKYYQENKAKLDANHAEYMEKHPEQKEKANQRKREKTEFWNKFNPSKLKPEDRHHALLEYKWLWDKTHGKKYDDPILDKL